VTNPYSDLDLGRGFVQRHFLEDVEDHELVWHRDKKDRHVTVMQGDDWWFQFDNEMPTRIKQGDTIHVPAMTYHRLLKGDGSLVLRIEEQA
jgi:quercetin dioxygenase-like cupin family protein